MSFIHHGIDSVRYYSINKLISPQGNSSDFGRKKTPMRYKQKSPVMSNPARQTGQRKLPPLQAATRTSPAAVKGSTSIYLSRSPVAGGSSRNYGGTHYRFGGGGSFNHRNYERMMVKGRYCCVVKSVMLELTVI